MTWKYIQTQMCGYRYVGILCEHKHISKTHIRTHTRMYILRDAAQVCLFINKDTQMQLCSHTQRRSHTRTLWLWIKWLMAKPNTHSPQYSNSLPSCKLHKGEIFTTLQSQEEARSYPLKKFFFCRQRSGQITPRQTTNCSNLLHGNRSKTKLLE